MAISDSIPSLYIILFFECSSSFIVILLRRKKVRAGGGAGIFRVGTGACRLIDQPRDALVGLQLQLRLQGGYTAF